MTPNKGQYVKIVFRNGIQLDGFVESWSDQKSVILSKSKEDIIVIMKTLEDVLAFKIVLNYESLNDMKQQLSQLQQKVDKVIENPPAQTDDEAGGLFYKGKNLAQLRELMINQEKKIISEQLKQHSITNTRTHKYEQPGLHKMFSAK